MASQRQRIGTPPDPSAHGRRAASPSGGADGASRDGCEAGSDGPEPSAPDPGSLDLRFMDEALAEARKAYAADEVPIGAVLVHEGRVIARAHNETRASGDPTAHAEILVIRRAAASLGSPRLPGTTVYTTVEPCFMCAGALVHARVERVVWAVRDPKFGGAASLGHTLEHPGLNHRVRTAEGSRADEARELLQGFFRNKR